MKVDRPWGYYTVVEEQENYSVKILHIKPGEETSYQRHSLRFEIVTLLEGTVEITHNERVFFKDEQTGRGVSLRIKPYDWHKFKVPHDQDKPSVLVEITYGQLDPEDFERDLQTDKYNRKRRVGSIFRSLK